MEAESDVTCDPIAVHVAKNRFEKRDRVGQDDRAIGRVELVEDAVTEGVEPGLHAVGKRRGAGNESDVLDGEACMFEEASVKGRRRIKASGSGFSVDVEGCQGGLEGGANGGDVALTAHLSDETAAWAESAVNSSKDGIVAGDAADPVEGSVGEDRIKLLVVGKRGGIVLLDVEIALAGSGKHG